jgi:S-adenosylmethionine:tRNA ribosyltransferase-isomerase
MLTVTDLSYDLPEERIAQEPHEPRDGARLLVYRRSTKEIQHAHVHDLPTLLPPACCIVANNSRVRPSRTRALLNDKDVEVFFLRGQGELRWEVLIGGGKHIQPGQQIAWGITLATIVEVVEHPSLTTFITRFDNEADLTKVLDAATLPLPPYITQYTGNDERYQTIFSDQTGSAAAPTAGLHITERLLAELTGAGHTWSPITLHVGLGTFLPLRKEKLAENSLHREEFSISKETATAVTKAKRNVAPVLAIGTTSFRTLESAWDHKAGRIRPGGGSTSLFVYPPYTPQVADILLTNFHLPKTSLLALVATMVTPGEEDRTAVAELLRIYEVALAERYRFASFGDAMIILP